MVLAREDFEVALDRLLSHGEDAHLTNQLRAGGRVWAPSTRGLRQEGNVHFYKSQNQNLHRSVCP